MQPFKIIHMGQPLGVGWVWGRRHTYTFGQFMLRMAGTITVLWRNYPVIKKKKPAPGTYTCIVRLSHHHTHSKGCWEFPGGPVVRTLCFHCRETGSIPGCRTKIKNFLKAQCATTGGLWGRDQRIFTFAWGCSWWWFKEKRQLWDHPGNYNVGWVLHGIQRWLLIFRCSNSKVLVTYF